MENFDELPIEELTDRELDLVSGGWMTQLIHMDYHKWTTSTTQRRSDTLKVANSKKGATAIPSMVALASTNRGIGREQRRSPPMRPRRR